MKGVGRNVRILGDRLIKVGKLSFIVVFDGLCLVVHFFWLMIMMMMTTKMNTTIV